MPAKTFHSARQARRKADEHIEKKIALWLRLDLIATVETLYRKAFNARDYALCWKIREDIQDRISGRPYIGVNPAKDNKALQLFDDRRIQMAIQHLHVSTEGNSKALPVSTDSGMPTHDTDARDGTDVDAEPNQAPKSPTPLG